MQLTANFIYNALDSWDKQRNKKVNQTPDVYSYTPSSKKSTNLMNFFKPKLEEVCSHVLPFMRTALVIDV